MIKQVLRLVSPGLFLPCFATESVDDNKVIVRPVLLSICAADQRYFQGNRPAQILKKKLPLALFHEALGEVIYDPSGELEKGTKCVLFPAGVSGLNRDSNYEQGAFFRSSNSDGFSQELISLTHEEVLPIPDQKNYKTYIFAELMSVCCQAIDRVLRLTTLNNKKIGIWGDGSMGYMMGIALKSLIPDCRLLVYGKHDEKLMMFSYADKVVNIYDADDVPELDVVFECVGGNSVQSAFKQILQKINPLGLIALMGVSEQAQSMMTRPILEKGITILGSTRSVKKDFEQSIELIKNPNVLNALQKVISKSSVVTSANDLRKSFIDDISVDFKSLIWLSL